MSDYHKKIRDILKEYEKNRGFFVRLLGFFGVRVFTRHPFIKMLRKFNFKPNSKNKPERSQILKGMIENGLDSRAAINGEHEVYESTLSALLPYSHMPIDKLKDFLGILYRNKLLNEDNINNINAKNASFSTIRGSHTEILHLLDTAKLVNQANFDFAITCAKPRLMASILENLNSVGLLNSENFDAIKAHPDLEQMDFALKLLASGKILNSENFDALKMCTGDNFMNELRSRFQLGEEFDKVYTVHKLCNNDPQFVEDVTSVLSHPHLHNDPAVFEKIVEYAEGRKHAAQMQADLEQLLVRQGQGSGYARGFFGQESSAANLLASSQAAHSSSSLSKRAP